MDASQYLEIFIDEVKELLETFKDSIEALAEQPGRQNTIHEIFCTARSLKGMAATMGFGHMQHLACGIENLFADILRGRGTVTGRMIDILFECLDAFDKYLENIKRTSGEGIEENEALIKALDEVILESEEVLKIRPKIVRKEKQEILVKKKEERTTKKTEAAAPATARMVHVDAEKLDDLMNQVSELIIIKNSLVSMDHTDQMLHDGIEYLENITARLHESIMQVRMVPLEIIVNKFPRMVRDFARKRKKRVELYMSGEDTKLDRTVADQIGIPLKHLLCNAAEWGIESREVRWQRGKHEKGAIYLNAYQEDGYVMIHVRDDGNGISTDEIKKRAVACGMLSPEQAGSVNEKEWLSYLFETDLSMREKNMDKTGRISGLMAARAAVEAIGGDIEVSTMPERGTEFIIRIPLALAIIQAVIAKIHEEKYAVALGSILSIEDVLATEVCPTKDGNKINVRGMTIPLLYMEEMLDFPPSEETVSRHPLMPSDRKENKILKVIIVKKCDKYAGLVVDGLIGQQEIVIKSLGRFISTDKIISGATILGDGGIALILDVNALL